MMTHPLDNLPHEDECPETGELHIPPEVGDAIWNLRPELQAKLSLRDIDDVTRPFRERIRELEAGCNRLHDYIAAEKARADSAEASSKELLRRMGALIAGINKHAPLVLATTIFAHAATDLDERRALRGGE